MSIVVRQVSSLTSPAVPPKPTPALATTTSRLPYARTVCVDGVRAPRAGSLASLASASPSNLGRHGLDRLGAPAGDDHLGSFGREQPRDGGPDAGATTADDRDLAVESHPNPPPQWNGR